MKHKIDINWRRRKDLMGLMDGGVAIIPTAPQQLRNGDVFFPFRPDSDFYYLTHFPEPEAVAVLAPGRLGGEFILFCRPNDATQESWEGRRAGLGGARDEYAADESFAIGDFNKVMPQILADYDKIFAPIGKFADFDRRLIACLNKVKNRNNPGRRTPSNIMSLDNLLHEMRLIKNKDEQNLMRKVAKFTTAAHRRAMATTVPGKYEYQVQGELESEFAAAGGVAAYPSIVAGGEAACILHYTDNCRKLADGELLLIDAGGELDCYGADVTRTFPVGGKFSAAQKQIYEIVLAAQTAAIESLAAEVACDKYHLVADQILVDGLIDLQLLKGERDEIIARGGHRKFTMHRCGHWLGMDVHDVGDYKVDGEWRLLQAGMVLTVEPGIYINPADDIDARWHNIGVRIEDDVLITKDGRENLTAGAPKQIGEIEELMADARAKI